MRNRLVARNHLGKWMSSTDVSPRGRVVGMKMTLVSALAKAHVAKNTNSESQLRTSHEETAFEWVGEEPIQIISGRTGKLRRRLHVTTIVCFPVLYSWFHSEFVLFASAPPTWRLQLRYPLGIVIALERFN